MFQKLYLKLQKKNFGLTGLVLGALADLLPQYSADHIVAQTGFFGDGEAFLPLVEEVDDTVVGSHLGIIGYVI